MRNLYSAMVATRSLEVQLSSASTLRLRCQRFKFMRSRSRIILRSWSEISLLVSTRSRSSRANLARQCTQSWALTALPFWFGRNWATYTTVRLPYVMMYMISFVKRVRYNTQFGRLRSDRDEHTCAAGDRFASDLELMKNRCYVSLYDTSILGIQASAFTQYASFRPVDSSNAIIVSTVQSWCS